MLIELIMSEIIAELNELNLKVVKLFAEADFAQALLFTQEAVKLGRENIGEHLVLADSLNNLAELYRIQGRYLEAKPLYIEVLNMRKSLLGSHPDVAQSFNNLAVFYVTQGCYLEAEEAFFTALDIWQCHLGEEHPEVAINLNNIAEVYREQGRYLEAEQMHLKVLAMRKRLFGNENYEIAQSLDNLAALYQTQARYSEAEQIHLEALAMRKSLFGEQHWSIAFTLNNLAGLYNSQNRLSEAERFYFQALNVCKISLGMEHPYVATTLNNIAFNYQGNGRYVEAEKMHLQALAMRKKIFGDEHLQVAMSLCSLAKLYQEQGRYLEAEKIYLSAYSLRKRLLSSKHPDIAVSLQNLAILYTYQGRYQEAEKQYLEALSLLKELLGEEHPEFAKTLNNLGQLYQKRGRYSEAEQQFFQALNIRKNLLGTKHSDIADSLNAIAVLYVKQGRYSQAEKMHLEAYCMKKSLLGDMHPDVAISLNDLAVLYYKQLQYSQAESFALKAYSLTKKLFGNQHLQVASVMNNLATIYGIQEEYLKAEEMHLEVLKIRKALLGEEHPEIADALNNLAKIYFSVGRYAEAEQKYREALSIRESLLGSHPDVAFSLNNLATILAATQRPTEALSYRVQASKINDKLISNVFAFSSENDRLALIEKLRDNFDLFLSLVYKHLPTLNTALQQALDFVLKRKALTTASLAAQNQALYSDRYPHLQEKFRQLSDLNAELVNLTLSSAQFSDFTIYQKQLAQLEEKYNNLQKQLASLVPEIQLSNQLPDRFAVAEALPTNSILVEFVCFNVFNFHVIPADKEAQWYPPRYLAFILPSGQPDAVQMIDLGEAQIIDELIRVFRSQASDHTKSTLAWGKPGSAPKLQIKPYNSVAGIQLSKALFEPISDLVKDFKHIIFVPDGNLNLVPFQTLPVDETGIRLLMDEHIISYLGVGRDILRCKVQTVCPTSTPMVIADPDFNLMGEKRSSGLEDWGNEAKKFINTLGDTTLSRAAGTRLLGESVAKKLKDARLYVGIEALETRLTTSECPSIMLIATHGLFLPDSEQELHTLERFSISKVENPMMRSGLALAGANTWLHGGILPDDAGKGFVFAQDIAVLDLWANELTVLSACDTARGDIKIGEGVFGLRRAFAVAGSKTLVMSLWKVPDKATALLMERFFDFLQLGIGRAEALQKAQDDIRRITVQELRKSFLGLQILKELLAVNELSPTTSIDCEENDTPLEHPFYWGAWICQGNTNSLV